MDGSLLRLKGIGEKRVRALREHFFSVLAEKRPPSRQVPVSALLELDAEYRCLAREGRLPRIAPRRNNPEGIAWLPILHRENSHGHFSAMFSNTDRAHRLGKTRDWVVIYRDGSQPSQWTVITSEFGPLRGKRIVRGREHECSEHYGPDCENQAIG